MVTVEEKPKFVYQFADVFNGITFLDYSPELNGIEGVWKLTKKKTTHNRFYKTVEERDAALCSTFETFQASPSLIANHVARFL
jgi:hypothetical protein